MVFSFLKGNICKMSHFVDLESQQSQTHHRSTEDKGRYSHDSQRWSNDRNRDWNRGRYQDRYQRGGSYHNNYDNRYSNSGWGYHRN